MKIIWWLVTIFVLLTGIMYLRSAQHSKHKNVALIKNVLGIILVASSVMLIVKSYQQLYLKECPITDSIWYTDLQCAKDIARHEKKLLFVDIGAPYCSLCKELDRTLFADAKVIKQLKHFVPVKLDGSKEENKSILKEYTIFGFPTILIIDAEDGSLLRKWGSDLYGIEPSAFINLLNAL
jgi:thiol:disulfide interchange protein